MNEELLSEYAFNKVQLLELAGYSSAVATAKVRKKPDLMTQYSHVVSPIKHAICLV
uniref:Uncharacterized protein n=1 Tax=Magallana gigas TaxID=29159 RepID=K1PML1_MAGGI